MTKCLFKALKAVDLENHADLFRLLGYDSAGALSHFRHEHLQQLHLTDHELRRFHALLDVLKEATREGKICPHYSKSARHPRTMPKPDSTRIKSSHAAVQYRHAESTQTKDTHSKNQPENHLRTKKSSSSIGSMRDAASNIRTQCDGHLLHRPLAVIGRQQPVNHQELLVPKAFASRPAVQHVKVSGKECLDTLVPVHLFESSLIADSARSPTFLPFRNTLSTMMSIS